MYLYVLNVNQRAEALAFNNTPTQTFIDPSTNQQRSYYDPDHAHLPLGAGVAPRAIEAGAPYPYAGMYILPTAIANNPAFTVMYDFLATLEVASVDPEEAFPSDYE